MKKSCLLFFFLGAMACTETPKVVDNMAVKTDLAVANRALSATDSLVIDVDSAGHIMLGNREVANLEMLTTQLVDSMQSIKKQYGKLPDTIYYRTKGDVLMGARGAIKDAIMDAKEKVK